MTYIPRSRAFSSKLCAIYAHCTELCGVESWLAIRASPEYRWAKLQRLLAVRPTVKLTVPVPTFPEFRPKRRQRVCPRQMYARRTRSVHYFDMPDATYTR